MTGATRNWFASGGEAYARFRPTYPDELAAFLAGIAPNLACAVDVGCGSGQFTCLLARHFDAVVGLDPSADQLAHAERHAHVRYLPAPAEAMGLPTAAPRSSPPRRPRTGSTGRFSMPRHAVSRRRAR